MTTITPQFRLFAEPQPWPKGFDGTPFDNNQFVEGMENVLKKTSMGAVISNYKPAFAQLPMGLRWTMLPQFGFPRRPFRVYRRRQKYEVEKILGAPENLSGSRLIQFAPNDMYLLGISVSLSPGQSVTISPRDQQGRTLPGKQITLTDSGHAVFRSPFMASLLITGSGVINSVAGVTTQSVLDAPDWQLIQVVGLPFPNGQTTAYNGEAQGFASALTHPETAAWQRLLLGNYLMPEVPALGDPSLSTPTWLPPNPTDYIKYLTQHPESLLFDIQKCLESTDDSSWDPAQRQPAFMAQRTVSGIYQNGTTPTTSGTATFPVVASTLLQVSSDNFGSLALGFGTYDFVNSAQDAVMEAMVSQAQLRGFDYKVEGSYILRPNFEFPFPAIFSSFSEKHTFAALSEDMPLPTPPADLRAPTLRQNRPVVRDGVATEAVKVSWAPPELPAAWGLAVSRNPSQSEWLNTENLFSGKSYQPYLTRAPQNEEPGEDTNRFHYVDPELDLPFFGTALTRYFVSAIDVFGRWSEFREAPHTGTAIPAQRPNIHSVKLALPDPDAPFPPPTSANVTVNLEIEFSWEWSDRRARQIQFAGQFFTAYTTAPQNAPGGFSTHSNNALNSVITVAFDMNGDPVSSSLGTTHRLSDVPVDGGSPALPPAPGLIQYRLIIENVTASFTGTDPFAVAYAAYVRGLERVREPVPEFSPWSPPFVSEMPDPRKPAVVNLPAQVQMTAFPDATKKARGRLDWAAANLALGYIVWEASETAIRFYLEPYLENKFPGDASRRLLPLSDTLVNRATQLRDLLLQNEYAEICAKSFARYTKDLLKETAIELELAGSSEILTVFRVSSVNRANIESEKSGPVFFAVPRLNRPVAPNLSLKPNGAGIEVQVFGNSDAATTAGYRVYRMRKTPFSTDVGAKGSPVYQETDAGWQSFTQSMLNGPTLSGQKILDSIAVRSWKPLYYQVTAIGLADPPRGVYTGESAGSTTREVYFAPDTLPLLEITTTPPVLPVLRCRTNLPFHKVPMGPAGIELFSMDITPGNGVQKTLLQQWKTAELPAAPVLTTPRIENVVSDPLTGITTFDIVLDASTTAGMVRGTDPLGRSNSVIF